MKQPLSLTWELESIFPGGSASPQFESFLSQLESDIERLRAQVAAAAAPADAASTKGLDPVIELLQSCAGRLTQASEFAGCLGAQNQARQRGGETVLQGNGAARRL